MNPNPRDPAARGGGRGGGRGGYGAGQYGGQGKHHHTYSYSSHVL